MKICTPYMHVGSALNAKGHETVNYAYHVSMCVQTICYKLSLSCEN